MYRGRMSPCAETRRRLISVIKRILISALFGSGITNNNLLPFSQELFGRAYPEPV
jgi:hypothetical protein